MSTSPSNSDIQLIPSIAHTPGSDHDGHFVQLYTDDGFLLDVLSRFIGGAIAVGNGAVVIATQAHQDGLAQRLKARGVDTAMAISQGRCVLLDANETLPRFMVNGSVDEARFMNTIGDILTQVRNAADDKDFHGHIRGAGGAIVGGRKIPGGSAGRGPLEQLSSKTFVLASLCLPDHRLQQ